MTELFSNLLDAFEEIANFENNEQLKETVNKYKKEEKRTMSKLKILYVHGYMGRGDGNASRLLREAFDGECVDCELDAPEFPVTDPDAMKASLASLMRGYDYVIASSLGAFYLLTAEPERIIYPVSERDAAKAKYEELGPFWRADVDGTDRGDCFILTNTKPARILVNPALPEDLRRIKEAKPDENPDLTDAFIGRLEKILEERHDDIFYGDVLENAVGVFGSRDCVAKNKDYFKNIICDDDRVLTVNMGHKLNDRGARLIGKTIFEKELMEGFVGELIRRKKNEEKGDD